ncbi:hypothetical protein CALVIDRAFT_603416 [Calocera viscosa TUFC12733]|uniref:NAD(P)-binding protein n=1 Tax=Calocera viscosa (strain TUFC12733) TaxID=1330018 RepID=A0A167FSA0_CALVF|nr:hypothetical protein CALVIDRAFT_603416 [Calocera viscosa TUFC12733]
MGKSVALECARAGMKLILVDVNLPGLKATTAETGFPEDSFYIKKVDLSKDAEVEALFADIAEKFGRLDYAVNGQWYRHALLIR